MKKSVSIFLAFVMVFSTFAVASFAKDENTLTDFSVSSVLDAVLPDDAAERKTSWFTSDDLDAYYLFIPRSIGTALVKVNYAPESATVTIDGEAVENGDSISLLNKEEIDVVADGQKYNVKIIDESKTASVFIETESGNLDYIHADKSNKEDGVVSIIGADGISVEYMGELEVKGRGNSTWKMEKKPYNIKLDKKTDLFGMGKTKKWSLIANHGDASLIRNSLAYAGAENAGMPYCPQFTPVDVYINNDYMGAYILTTRIGIDESNVDIDDLEKETEEVNEDDLDTYPQGGSYGSYAGLIEGTRKWYEIPNNPEDITGGYIIEMELANRYTAEASGFVTSRGQPFTMKTPEYVSRAQIEYISNYYQEVEDAIYNGASMEELDEIADVESLAQLYLINEWVSNMDGGLTSTYFYKPAGDKLYAGPVWDFDIGFGNNDLGRFGNDYNDPTKWTVCYNRMYRNTIFGKYDIDEQPTVYNVLTKNESFVDETEKVWNGGMKDAISATIKWMQEVYVPAVEGSAVANAIRWNIFGTSDVEQIKEAYSNETEYVISFAGIKANTITEGIGEVQNNAPETNAFVKFFKGILVGMNDVFEWAIVTFGLINKI